MAVVTRRIKINTRGFTEIIDITADVSDAVAKSSLENGIVTVFHPGSTGGITTLEYEPGLLRDLPELLEKLIPSEAHYHHNETWGDGNGSAHLRSALLRTSLTIPFIQKRLPLGTWQQIVYIDFDNRPRQRELICQIIGE